MQKITYENYANGLKATFSSCDPLAFLAAFDGSSTACTAITYKPVEFDGERFISANLNAKTITFDATWHGVRGGKLSDAASLEKWEELQRIFVPGKMGKLTWTDGKKTRFIECRTAEFPNFTRVVGNKLSATFELTADYPYWQDVAVREIIVESNDDFNMFTFTNDCGVDVPFVITCRSPIVGIGSSVGTVYIDSQLTGEIEIDTLKCTATINGENANRYLGADSTFFKFPPGDTECILANISGGHTKASVKITWRDHYISVG